MGSAGYHVDERAPLAAHEKPAPLDLSHHFSAVTKRRTASKVKQVYKFFQIPGILNIAGGSYLRIFLSYHHPPAPSAGQD